MGFYQVLVNSIVNAGGFGLIAMGLTLTYDILKFANFSHTEFAMVGIYLGFLFNVIFGLNLVISVLISMILGGIIVVCIDKIVFKPLRQAQASDLVLMIASYGLSIMLRNIVRLIFGSQPKFYNIALQKPFLLCGGRIHITTLQIVIIIFSILFMIAYFFLMYKTKFGKVARAVSDNLSLAQGSGINVEIIISRIWFIVALLSVLGGILLAMDTQIYPGIGSSIMLPVFCITILGGLGSSTGAILGAFLLAFAQNFALWLDFKNIINLGGLLNIAKNSIYISTNYKAIISFIILIIVLFLKPSGIMGKKGGK